MKKNLLIGCLALSVSAANAQTTCNLPRLHISKFTSVFPSAQPDSMRIPATHTFQLITQEGDPYTDPADGVMKGTFDFAGYVGIGGSSEKGYVDLNHELGSWPSAGVSVLDVHFDATSKLWKLDHTKPVDFGAIGGTGRNCSGGVTPWGTTVTCEETLPGGDGNGDGYEDVGWAVEINPVTRSIVDYDGDGTPDKVWKMGRMSHENCVLSNDSTTVYEANDENPGYVFKYVMKQKGNLSDGDLYVLKLDGALGTINVGSWVKIPNSTPTECNNVRSAATSAGATNFNSLEDVEISPLDGMIYFTSKASSRVYRFRDYGATVGDLDVFVGNKSQQYLIDYGTGTAYEQWRDGNDNLTFDEFGNLYVIQDGGRNHVWMVSPCHTQANPDVKLFMVTPDGCEPTGMNFTPDHRFMFISIQHPSSSNAAVQKDAAGNGVTFNKESLIVIARRGYLGADTLEDTTLSVAQLNNPYNTVKIANVYPNPTSSDVNLSLNSPVNQDADVKIYNVMGAVVLQQKVNVIAGNGKVNLSASNIPAGVYTIVVSTKNNVSVQARFVKQ